MYRKTDEKLLPIRINTFTRLYLVMVHFILGRYLVCIVRIVYEEFLFMFNDDF
jgi:hypothetical protein